MKRIYLKPAAVCMTVALLLSCLPAAPVSQAAKSVTAQHAVVHDPSVIYCQENGKYYMFGSHQSASVSSDMINWESVDDSLYKRDVARELKESFAWAGYRDGSTNAKDGMALWAPCAIYNPYYEKANGKKGSYMLYYPVSSNYKRGCIGFAVSDKIAKDYEYADTIMYSGFTKKGGKDETNCKDTVDTNYENTNLKELIDAGTITFNDSWLTGDGGYNIGSFPQAIDPTVFFDADDNLWLVYGSHGGGVWLLPLDRATGKPKFLTESEVAAAKDAGQNADAYFGYQLTSEGEGPFILYDKEQNSYVLTVTYGQITDGYNQRLFRSDKVNGIYKDCAGNSAVYQSEVRNQDALGVKLMGNYMLKDTPNYQFGGHNSLIAVDGQLFDVYHQRFADTASYSDRVHQVFCNEKGWYCMAVYEYLGDKISEKGYKMSEMAGSYQFVNHGSSTSSDKLTAYDIELNEDGTISGMVDGTWSHQSGKNYMSLTINGVTYDGVFFKQQDESGQKHSVMTFTAVGSNNECVWGSRYDKAPKTEKLNADSKKPVYAFDFSVTDNYMVNNTGTATVAAMLTGNATVTEDEEMGSSLLCKDTDSSLKLSANAFAGIKDGLSIAFWTKSDKNGVLFSAQANADNSVSDAASPVLFELRGDGSMHITAGETTNTIEGNVDLSKWSYVGLSVNKEKIVLYVNGKTVKTEDVKADLFELLSAISRTNIATNLGKGSVAMDNIEIYATALTEEDFDDKYNTNYSSSWYIDFGPKGSPQWESYMMMYNTTLYKKGGIMQGYGFTEEVDAFETSSGGNKIRDFVYKKGGEKFTFKIDLPNGTYSVFVYSGNKEADNTLNFYFNDNTDDVHTQVTPEGVGSDNYGGENTYETYVNTGTLSITLWGDETLGSDAVTGALNSLEIVKISDEYPEPEKTAEPETATDEKADDMNRKENGTLPWILVGIVIVCVAIGGGYYVKKTKKKS